MKILDNYKHNVPALIKEPLGMRSFANGFNDSRLEQEFPSPGIHRWLNSSEIDRSTKDRFDFHYHINDMGFRDNYPIPNTKDVLGFFGCSFTFGEGLPTELNFPSIVSKKVNMPMLNLGMPAASFQRIYLTFLAACNVWNIKTAVITLPNYDRYHYVTSKSKLISMVLPHRTDDNESDTVRKALLKHFSKEYFLGLATDAIGNMITLAKYRGINLIIGTWEQHGREIIRQYYDYEPPFYSYDHNIDPARDNIHPGPIAASRYANEIIKKITKENYVK